MFVLAVLRFALRLEFIACLLRHQNNLKQILLSYPMSNNNSPEAEFTSQLIEYCRSDALLEDRLREKISDKLITDGLDLDAAELCEEVLLLEVCDNERGTMGMIRCILDCVPGTFSCADEDGNASPLCFVEQKCHTKNCSTPVGCVPRIN